MQSAIALDHVGKCYQRFGRPIDRLAALLAPRATRGELFWALKDITLNIPSGHTVGVVGRNGSGKSTLLQVIAGTLPPSTGRRRVAGRIAALLELGSGFNPDFTGRENALFQGHIIGLSRQEIASRMPEIEAFAEIGTFIDEPLKTYSSGMALRLAFAVAISVEPDILIVDEALAVGDEAFQRKCFSRIRDLQGRGATVLFVSHSGSAVVELCDEAILLDGGELLAVGAPRAIVTAYHQLLFSPPHAVEPLRHHIRLHGTAPQRAATDDDSLPAAAHAAFDPSLVPSSTVEYPARGARLCKPVILDSAGNRVNILVPREWYTYAYEAHFDSPAFRVRFGMLIKTITGVELAGAVSHPFIDPLPMVDSGTVVHLRFPFQCLLPAGAYFLNAGISAGAEGGETYLHRLIDVVMFRVQPTRDSLATGLVDLLIEPSWRIASPGAPDAQAAAASNQASLE